MDLELGEDLERIPSPELQINSPGTTDLAISSSPPQGPSSVGCLEADQNGTSLYHSTKPPDGFSQLEDPALSLGQLQEAFARAQELQEKRSMEHAANHDLLMLSEDLELGSEDNFDKMPLDEGSGRSAAESTRLGNWLSPNTPMKRLGASGQGGHLAGVGGLADAVVESGDQEEHSSKMYSIGGNFSGGHVAPKKPGELANQLISQFQNGEITKSELRERAKGQSEAVRQKLVKKLHSVLVRAETMSRHRARAAQAILRLRQVGSFGEVTMEEVVARLEAVCDLLAIDSMQILLCGEFKMAIRGSSTAQSNEFSGTPPTPAIEELDWTESKSIASHVLTRGRPLVFHNASEHARYHRHVDGPAKALLVIPIQEDPCHKWEEDDFAPPSEGEEEDPLAYLRRRGPPMQGVVHLRRVDAPSFTSAEADAYYKVAMVAMTLASHAAEVQRAQIKADAQARDHGLQSRTLSAALHAGIHLEALGAALEASAADECGARACQLLLLSQDKKMFWTPQLGPDYAFNVSEVAAGEAVKTREPLLLNARPTETVGMPRDSTLLTKACGDTKVYSIIVVPVLSRLPASALVNFTDEGARTLNEKNAVVNQPSCNQVLGKHVGTMHGHGGSQMSPGQFRARRVPESAEQLIGVLQVLNKKPPPPDEEARRSWGNSDSAPIDNSFSMQDMNILKQVVKTTSSAIAGALVHFHQEAQMRQLSLQHGQSKKLLAAVQSITKMTLPGGVLLHLQTQLAELASADRCRLFFFESGWRKMYMYVGENAGHKPDLILVQRKDQCLPSATAEQSVLQNLILQGLVVEDDAGNRFEHPGTKTVVEASCGVKPFDREAPEQEVQTAFPSLLPTNAASSAPIGHAISSSLTLCDSTKPNISSPGGSMPLSHMSADKVEPVVDKKLKEHLLCLPLSSCTAQQGEGKSKSSSNRIIGVVELMRQGTSFTQEEIELTSVLKDMGVMGLSNTMHSPQNARCKQDRHHLQWLFADGDGID